MSGDDDDAGNVLAFPAKKPEPVPIVATLILTWTEDPEGGLRYSMECVDGTETLATDPKWLAGQLRQVAKQLSADGFDWHTDTDPDPAG